MNTKRYLALVMALVMAFSLVVPVSAEAPTSVDRLSHSGTGTHETAILTVYADNDVAAVGSIKSDMSAKLELNYGNYSADSTITVAGQTEDHANLTTFTLNGSGSSGINLDGSYFPGFGRLGGSTEYAIQFVDELSTSSHRWNYTFKKSVDTTSGVTLEVVPGNSALANDYWQDLKDEAFKETHDNQPEDSYIKLAAGSYLQMDKEKLTVESELWLDDFSTPESVDENVTNASGKLTYTNNSTTAAYQLLLKAGTQFSLGRSIAEVRQDLLVTMSNVTKKYEDSILGKVHNYLNKNTEKQLAESLLEVFSEIAGLVQSTGANNPVVITFGRPATEVAISDPVVVNNGDSTTTTSTAIAVDTTGTTTTYNIKTTTTTTTETSSGNESTTTITTKPVPVDTATAAEVDTSLKDAVEGSAAADAKAAVDSYSAPNSSIATFTAALNDEDNDPTSAKVLQTTAAANAIAAAAAKLTSEQTGAVSEAKVILQTKLTEVEGDNENKVTSVTYDITPVAQLYNVSGDELGEPVALKNADIKDGQTFTFNIPVPSTITSNYVKVTHTSAGYDADVNYYEVQGTGGVRYVTVTVSHFSAFELKAIEDSEISSGFDHRWSLSLDDEIAINLYFAPPTPLSNPEEYTVEYYTTVNSIKGEKQTKQFDQLNVIELTNLGDYYYIQLAKFAAKQMTDTVTVTLKHGNTVIATWEYSIKSYCNTVIENTGSNFTLKLQNLCKAVLEYGAYAQRYFHYKESDLAYEGTRYYTFDTIPAEFAGTPFGSTGILKNLYLEDRVTISFYVPATYTGDDVSVVAAAGLKVTQSTEVIYGTQYTRYSVSGFAAKMLNQTVTVTVDGNVYTWSPLSYAHQNQNSVNTDLANVVHALYNYYVYADKYFNNNL